MEWIKKVISIILIAALLTSGHIPILRLNTFAASLPVDIKVDNYSEGKVSISWSNLFGAKSFKISYHTPQNGLIEILSNEPVNTYTISDLYNDYIYDIKVEIYNDIDQGGALIGEGLRYFLPKITFYSSRVGQERQALSGGGYEMGDKPRLKLRWVMPKVWEPLSDSFVYTNEPSAISNMRDSLDLIYNNDSGLANINFKINISNSLITLNSGSSQSAIIVNQGSPEYTAYVSGNKNITCNVMGPDQNGYLTLDLIGRKDLETPLNPKETYGLPDGDILPGSVYYMNVKPDFADSMGESRFAVSVGKPSDLNGSILSGAFPYTYTPLRFQLSKDAADNVYVKIYKINQGSLDLPRMFYEVQTSDDPTIPGDWGVKKTIDDSFFSPGAKSAITLVTGIGPNNKIYYKIVVRTDTSDDRIDSLPMHYTLAEDTSKAPVPRGITVIGRDLVTRSVPESDQIEKSTDITISWEKPANWDEIRSNEDPQKDVVYHVLLNTVQEEIDIKPYPELKGEGELYGYFPLKYRKVVYFSSKSVRENGNRLEYTIKGFELFKGNYFDGIDQNGLVIEEEDISNPENYPDFLLPNKVYYLQMYTTTNEHRNSNDSENMSDKSIIISFTTKGGEDVTVPLPKLLRVNVNDADIYIGEPSIVSNYLELQFDKVNINWNNYTTDSEVQKKVYYDLYMSTRTDINSFKLIGTTQNLKGDLAFIGADDEQSTSVKVLIRNFSQGNEGYSLFGPKLRPNTTYYFMAKTRLSIETQENDKVSQFTNLLAVTTVKGIMGDPDQSSKKPLTPVDFGIAKDVDGELMVSGSKAVFSWTRKETDVVYQIISTARLVEPEEGEYDASEDALYQSFAGEFGEVVFDPSLNELPQGFQYNPVTKECIYTIDSWLFPNRLYYFSIRALKKDDLSIYSSWASIPLTTSLIEQPMYLEAIRDVQLGFYFLEGDINTRAEDYTIEFKSESDLKYSLLSKNRYSIVKLGNICYVRVVNLKTNNSYGIRVYKNDGKTLMYQNEGMITRDSQHEIDVKWTGLPGYKYEIAIKTVEENGYTNLWDENMEGYLNSQGELLPYMSQKTMALSGSLYEEFYARIKTVPVRLSDGTYESRPLNANTKYHIKVRAVKIDPVDPSIVSYSKYIGPVEIRTDFSQEDYDEEDNRTRREAAFLDKVKKLEQGLFWRIDIPNGLNNKVLLKEERLVNAIKNNGGYTYSLDISEYSRVAGNDNIYIPLKVIQALKTYNTSLSVRTYGAEYTIRPDTIDVDSNKEIKELREKTNVNDTFIKLSIGRKEKSSKKLPLDMERTSELNDFKIEALGTAINYKQLREGINERIYNKDSGLVNETLNGFLNKKFSKNITSRQLEEIIDGYVFSIEVELSNYLKRKVEGDVGIAPMALATKNIRDFNTPVMTKLSYNTDKSNGLKFPYVSYDGASGWQKLSQNIVYVPQGVVFNTVKTGEYAIFAAIAILPEAALVSPYAKDVNILFSNYDLSEIFGSMKSFNPDDKVNVKEVILLYEKVAGVDKMKTQESLKDRVKSYGMEDFIGAGGTLREITRQETARVLMLTYSYKTGVDIKSLIPNRYTYISDEKSINKANYKHVLMVVDLRFMLLNSNGTFLPDNQITRGQIATAFVRMLKHTGDIES